MVHGISEPAHPHGNRLREYHAQRDACRGPSAIREGLCLVNSMHVSSSVFVHDGGLSLEREEQKWIDWMQWLGTTSSLPLLSSRKTGGRQ